jgi:RNA recognition motif-containing protein
MLYQAFSHYPSLKRVRVVRDKKTNKSKGYGFVSLTKLDDYLKAMKEMDGKYVGIRPIKLRKSNWKDRQVLKK